VAKAIHATPRAVNQACARLAKSNSIGEAARKLGFT